MNGVRTLYRLVFFAGLVAFTGRQAGAQGGVPIKARSKSGSAKILIIPLCSGPGTKPRRLVTVFPPSAGTNRKRASKKSSEADGTTENYDSDQSQAMVESFHGNKCYEKQHDV